ncbi:MAG: DUF3822 family protein [Chloroflexota bacterium]
MTGLRSAVSCYDKIFEKASSNKYNLSIRLISDGLFFTIYDTETHKYIGFESDIMTGITEVYDSVRNNQLFAGRFRNTVCVIPASKYTLVPDALFLPDRATEYLSFVHEIHPGEDVSTSNLLSTDAVVVYASEMGYFELIRECFPSAKVIPMVTSLIDLVVPAFRNSADPVMCIHLNRNDFDVLLIQNGNMVYCNNFSYSNAEDLVYFTIFVIDQLKINVEKVKAFLSGDINVKSDVMRLIRKYVRTVNILNVDNQAQVSYALNEIQVHNFPDLFNPRLCEL